MSILISIPIIIFISVVLVMAIVKRNHHGRNKFTSNKGNKLVLASYVSILVISSVIYYLLPSEEFTYEKITKDELDEVLEIYPKIYQGAEKGKITELAQTYEHIQRDFVFNDEQLIITLPTDYHELTIFIEKTSTLEEQIKVFQFVTPTIYNEIDFSDSMKPLQVKLEGNNLVIQGPGHTELNYASFSDEFTISQFQDDGNGSFASMEDISTIGSSILYIQLANNIDLSLDNIEFIEQVQYVK